LKRNLESVAQTSMLQGAIIGFGEVAKHGHCPAYADSTEVKIVAVVERTEERRQLAQQVLSDVQAFASLDELAAASIKIDFVDICTPPALHAEPMLDALAKGWNVLCEKPLLLDSIELEKVRALMKQSGRAVVPVHNWKFAPMVQRATELLRSGAVGPLHEVEIETLRVKDCAVADPNHPNWRRDPNIAGGGILMDHGWHAVYLAHHWFNQEPIDVSGSLHRSIPTEVEDEANLLLSFPSGQAKIFLSWRADERRNRMRLIGEQGEIALDDDTLKVGEEWIRFENALSAGSHHPDWFKNMLPAVIASFRSPKSASASFNEAALCLSVIRRAYELA
jgi:predicted dehydrogenase